MLKLYKPLIVYKYIALIIGALLVCGSALSQSSKCSDPKLEALVIQADSLILRYQLHLADSIIQLSKSSNYQSYDNCEAYLSLALQEGELYEFKTKYDSALIVYHKVLPTVIRNGFYRLEADLYISMARTHEVAGRKHDTQRYLDASKELIESYGLEELLPRWSLRASSYYRIYVKDNSKAYNLAKQAVTLGRKFDQIRPQTDGYMVMGMLEKDSKLRLDYYQKGRVIAADAKAYHTAATMSYSLASIHLDRNELMGSESAARKTLRYEKQLLNHQKEEEWLNYWYRYIAHQILNELFVIREQLDSAYHHLNISHQYQNKLNKLTNQETINDLEIKNAVSIERLKQNILTDKLEQSNLSTAIMAIVSSILLLLIGIIYRSRQQIKKQNELINQSKFELQQLNSKFELLLSEIHHRVKNNLQNIISLVELQAFRAQVPEIKESLSKITNKIHSIALIHDQLYKEGKFDEVNVSSYINYLLDHFKQINHGGNQFQYQLQIKNIHLNSETIIPLGIILTELITNSIKYANPSTELVLKISLNKKDDQYTLTFSDNGKGFSHLKHEKKKSKGMLIINSLVRQLRGSVEMFNDNGAHTSILFKEKTVSDIS